MSQFKLAFDSQHLAKEYVLVQALKKAHNYIRRYNWYADVLELDLMNADLEARIAGISQEILHSGSLKPDPLNLVLAPKSQAWDLKGKKWAPVDGVGAVERRLRPLAHLSARDQIIATAFMILLADLVESRQGDPRVDAMAAHNRRVVSYGHRLLCDRTEQSLRFRWGNVTVYRQYYQPTFRTALC